MPTAYDLVWSLVLLCYLGLVVGALISLGRSGRQLGPIATLVWAVLIVLLPLLGPAAWFLAGRRSLATPALD